MAEASGDPRFHAFQRHDAYGPWGMAPQPLLERLRLALFTLMFPVRVLMAAACIVGVYASCRLSTVLPISALARSSFARSWGMRWCSYQLYVMGFRVSYVRDPAASCSGGSGPAAGIVSNHCSWADIVIHMSRNWPAFAARDGVQNIPIVGSVCDHIDCVYVSRGKGTGVSTKIVERMTNPTSDNPILLFPEGTTTNGKVLLPFKTGAFLAGKPLQPVLIRYHTDRFSACWDAIEFPRHLWLLHCQPHVDVTVYELPLYVPSEEERQDPVLFANNVRATMLQFGSGWLKPSNSTFEDKMVYYSLHKKQL